MRAEGATNQLGIGSSTKRTGREQLNSRRNKKLKYNIVVENWVEKTKPSTAKKQGSSTNISTTRKYKVCCLVAYRFWLLPSNSEEEHWRSCPVPPPLPPPTEVTRYGGKSGKMEHYFDKSIKPKLVLVEPVVPV